MGSLQATIPAGSVVGPSSDACVSVSLVDDDILEATQSFSATLSVASAEEGFVITTTVSIMDIESNDWYHI